MLFSRHGATPNQRLREDFIFAVAGSDPIADSHEKDPSFDGSLSWLTFAETFRTIYNDISPLKFKEVRELVDDYEAGSLELQEKSHANV